MTLTSDTSTEGVEGTEGADCFPIEFQSKVEDFVVMVVGQSGLGKSTFLNTLYRLELPNETIKKSTPTVEAWPPHIFRRQHRSIRLTMIDTPGYGADYEIIRNQRMIQRAIMQRMATWRTKRINSAVHGRDFQYDTDERVNIVFYFLPPHRLTEIDLDFMKRLSGLSLVVPILAKADAMTTDELQTYSAVVADQMEEYGIPSPQAVVEMEPGSQGNACFAVIGGTRVYPWGSASMDNEDHCDIVRLRKFLADPHCFQAIKNNTSDLYNRWADRSKPTQETCSMS